MKTLVLGMGNPILSDDGVGLFIAREVGRKIDQVDVITTPLVGLSLLEILAGYDRLVLIDAMTGGKSVGEISKLEEGDGSLHLFSSHGLNFPELMRLGRELGYEIPEVATIYGIEIGNEVSFGEGLSPELQAKVQAAIPELVDDIRSSLSGGK
jgi:hydrogenase maturation protease